MRIQNVLFVLFIIVKNLSSQTSSLQIKIPAFKNGEEIPAIYSCKGKNINPSIEISNIPANTQALILVMDDPDAPGKTFIHWLLYIPLQKDKFIIRENEVPINSVIGKNSAGTLQYFGPCPPSGLHHYYFKVYALDILLSLPNGFSKEEMDQQINKHVLARGSYMGTYQN